MNRITKEEIVAGLEMVFKHGRRCLVQHFDPDLVQVDRDEIRLIIRHFVATGSEREEAFLACNRTINGVIYRVMDETCGSEYEAYYMDAFNKPGVPPKYNPAVDEAI